MELRYNCRGSTGVAVYITPTILILIININVNTNYIAQFILHARFMGLLTVKHTVVTAPSVFKLLFITFDYYLV
jgi:hypothetical protein